MMGAGAGSEWQVANPVSFTDRWCRSTLPIEEIFLRKSRSDAAYERNKTIPYLYDECIEYLERFTCDLIHPCLNYNKLVFKWV